MITESEGKYVVLPIYVNLCILHILNSGPGFTKGLKQKIVITLREKS